MKSKLLLSLFYLLRPLLEKTWKGTFKDSKLDKPTVDVERWERALNGQAIRLLHSINDGAYCGETLLIWDEQRKMISFAISPRMAL